MRVCALFAARRVSRILYALISAHFESGHEINCLLGLGPATSAHNLGNAQSALRFAGIAKADFVTGPQFLEKAGGKRNARGGRAGSRLGIVRPE